MFRIVLFLVLIALAAAGCGVGCRAARRRRRCRGAAGASTPRCRCSRWRSASPIVAAMLAWSTLRGLWRTPEKHPAQPARAPSRARPSCHHPRAARDRSRRCRCRAPAMPMSRAVMPRRIRWRCCCTRNRRSSTATAPARAPPSAPWPNARIRGCSACAACSSRPSAPTIPVAAVGLAEEALKLAPASTWASQAVLGFRCARGDWSGALTILDNNLASGLIDKPTWRRQRGVLLTARALELETVDRDLSRDSVMEAVKLAPTLVPAAVLASKYQSELHQVRRSMRIVEAAWLAHPHPDLADAYAHVKLGDSARQRLTRVETLAAKAPGHLEGALAMARAAIDAAEFARAREALAPFIVSADPARGAADGRDRAHRTWRQRPGAGLDLARGARAARSGLDRGRLCLRQMAAGVAGLGPARCVRLADAARRSAVGQECDDRILALRGSHAGAAPRRAAKRTSSEASGASSEPAGRGRGPPRRRTICRSIRAAPPPSNRRPLSRQPVAASPAPPPVAPARRTDRILRHDARRPCSAPAAISANRPLRR